MSLSPELTINDDEQESVDPSRTFTIDFEKGRILSTIIEGPAAVEQFIHMALRTDRFAHAIYSDEVGNELQETLSDVETSDAYKEMEIPRLITEAIEFDERILSVGEFEIEKREDAFHVSFVVEIDEGTLELEEVLNSV